MLNEIVASLDLELQVGEFDDSSHNGLQVENSGQVSRVVCGVDASLELFGKARAAGAGLVVCHHGLSWGDSLKRITGLNYRRVRFLLEHDIALYACHLPLDAHPGLGNNAGICAALGLEELRPFGLYRGRKIGFAGRLPRPMPYSAFLDLVRRAVNPTLRTMDFGRQTVRTVAVVSGGAAGELAEAAEENVDVYLSGEPTLAAYVLAQDAGINGVFAGHYATEVFGPRALAVWLRGKLGVEAEFVDTGSPF